MAADSTNATIRSNTATAHPPPREGRKHANVLNVRNNIKVIEQIAGRAELLCAIKQNKHLEDIFERKKKKPTETFNLSIFMQELDEEFSFCLKADALKPHNF